MNDAPSKIVHIFTVDVEDYFQAGAFETLFTRDQWERMPRRVMPAVERLLELLDRFETKATFFCLGWVASRTPELIRRIAKEGHEVAVHGWWHKSVVEFSPHTFRDDVRAARQRMEMEAGQPVRGFRAPNFSLTPGLEWALEVLVEEGYWYDSSVLPLRRNASGYPGARPGPHVIRLPAGDLLEVPISTLNVFGRPLVAAGGNYFRQLPYGMATAALRQAEGEGRPGVFYIHPWELDPDQPRLPVPLKTKLRHYRGLKRTAKRLERLLSEFRFTSVADRLLRPKQAHPAESSGSGTRRKPGSGRHHAGSHARASETASPRPRPVST